MAALAVAGHLSAAELGRLYRAARDRVARGHLQVVWLLVQGRSRGEVARVMGLSGCWVGEIVRRYNEAGPDGLGDPAPRDRRRRAIAGPRGRGGATGRAGGAAGRRRAVDGAEGGGGAGGPPRPRGVGAGGGGRSRESRPA